MATLCFAACGVAALIHGLTFFGVDPMTVWPALWALHPAAMVAAFSTLFSGIPLIMRRGTSLWDFIDSDDDGQDPVPTRAVGGPGSTLSTPNQSPSAEADFARRLRPSRYKITAAVFAVYAAVNFGACLALLQGGVPTERGNEYVLTSHGHVIQVLSSTEYAWYRAEQTRLATGHWMFLFFLSGALWRRRKTRPISNPVAA